jgi:hypothetical protein
VFDWVVHPPPDREPGHAGVRAGVLRSIDALGVLIAILLLRRAIPARG